MQEDDEELSLHLSHDATPVRRRNNMLRDEDQAMYLPTHSPTRRHAQWLRPPSSAPRVALIVGLLVAAAWWGIVLRSSRLPAPARVIVDLESTHIKCRPNRIVAGQRTNCHIAASLQGEPVLQLPRLALAATITDDQGQIVERPEAVQGESRTTVVSLVPQHIGSGSLMVTFSEDASALASFTVSPDAALASATRLLCQPSSINVGERVICRMHFFDEHGNPTSKWPQNGPGLGALPATTRGLGTAEDVESVHAGFTGEAGVSGFRAAASGQAGIEVTLGEATKLTAWVTVL